MVSTLHGHLAWTVLLPTLLEFLRALGRTCAGLSARTNERSSSTGLESGGAAAHGRMDAEEL